MRDPFIAIDAATDLRAHARALRRSWETVLGGGAAGLAVRPVIEASWRRAGEAGLDPDHPHPRRAFAADELADRRQASGLADCIDVLRSCLGAFALDAEHVMVVVDARCRILWMEGDPRVRRRADRIAFEEGMDWTEASVGTNAIGTAIAIDHAVQVFSAEHYAVKQHPWWCSAAPIHDPASGDLLGVVDLSGPMRTAHPHSLALVRAAAAMAEERLRSRRELEDERLRRAFLERTLGSRRTARALLAGDGRVLDGEDAALAGARLDVPPGGGLVALPAGGAAVAEPLEGGRGYVLWHSAAPGTPPPSTLRLELLGPGTPRMRLGRAEPVQLSLRHAEVLCLLALHPEGLTAEALTLQLYGDAGKDVSARAQVSRLRRLLPGLIDGRPYRLRAAVSADVLDVERAVRRGDRAAALGAYPAPLLPGSTAPRIAQVRAQLDAAVRRAALSGGPDLAWAWLQTRSGRDDGDALAAFVRAAAPADPRRGWAAARLRGLQLS